METNGVPVDRQNKISRRQILEKKKAVVEIVKAASSPYIDHLASFPAFRHYRTTGKTLLAAKKPPNHKFVLICLLICFIDMRVRVFLCQITEGQTLEMMIGRARMIEGLYYFDDISVGLSVYLKSGRGDKLPSPVKQYIHNLLKANMEGPYGSEWHTEEKVKRREMVAPEACYIFVYVDTYANTNQTSTGMEMERASSYGINDRASMVGFVHFRFVVEEEIPVLYVYELQLEPHVQRKGLGNFLMQLIELIAHKNQVGAVMLTVQKANLSAMDFYISKLRYTISTISPSRINHPLIGLEKNYEILCKAFDHEAKATLEIGKEQ